MSIPTNTLPAWMRRNCTVCPLHPHRADFLPPNNSLKLTRRAGPSGPLGLPAVMPQSPSNVARFRRAA